MDKNTIRMNKQKAMIADKVHAAMKTINGFEGPVQHPFISASESLKRELEFLKPFENTAQFAPVKELYNSALSLKEKIAEMSYDGKVTPEGEQTLPLLEFHVNMLKIHRVIIARTAEVPGLIPPAPTQLQKQVEKTYDALNQLKTVLELSTQVPKAPSVTSKRAPPRARSISSRSKQQIQEPEEPLVLPLRVSPFITEGKKKGTVTIDGIDFPRYI